MRIVHTEASCGWGGQEIRILEESLGMLTRGHEVVLLCPPEAPIFAEARRRGLEAFPLPIARKNARGLAALRAWLRANPAHVVNTHSSTDSWLAAIACASLAKPPALVRTRHISAPVAPTAANRWLYGRAMRHVVTTGEALRQELIERLRLSPERVSSVPTGIDGTRFAPGDRAAQRHALGLDPHKRYLGIVATLRSWKGHLDLVEAFALLDRPEWTLLVVGDGPMRGMIESKVAEMGLAGRVCFVGQQQRPEEWLRALDVFCLPSYANEGVPQALVQAMLTALPVVTTPVGAILEAVSDEKTALVAPPRDPHALAHALRRLIDRPDFAEALGREARNVALARFGKTAMLEQMEAVFATALEKR